MYTDSSPKQKWCRLCSEWKTAILPAANSTVDEPIEPTREITYCPQCGAKLRDVPE
jgi:hypothetical protein